MRVHASVDTTRARECGRGSEAMALCERGGAAETPGLGSPLARAPPRLRGQLRPEIPPSVSVNLLQAH